MKIFEDSFQVNNKRFECYEMCIPSVCLQLKQNQGFKKHMFCLVYETLESSEQVS